MGKKSVSSFPEVEKIKFSRWGACPCPFNFWGKDFLERGLGELGYPFGASYPFLSMSEDDHSVMIKAEIPDVNPQDVHVEVRKNRLTIWGEKKREKEKEKNTHHITEIMYGEFARTLELPFSVDPQQVKASLEKGVLSVVLTKPQEANFKSHSIPVEDKGA